MDIEINSSAKIMGELQEAVDHAINGIRDAESMRQACDHMDRLREEVFAKHGILDIGLPAIREVRES
jgi:hypothetical protein